MMKSMEEYINSIYERYEESERNHEVYKKVRMTRKRPLAAVCGVAACLIVGCICVIGYNHLNSTPNIEKPIFVDNSKVYTEYIEVDSIGEKEQIKLMIEESKIVGIVDKFTLENTISEIKNRRVVVSTNVNLHINKILKGDDLLEGGRVNCSLLGGKISIRDLQKDKEYDWESWEKSKLGCDISENEKDTTYYETIVRDAEMLENDKQYLVFLVPNYMQEDAYVLCNNVYGIMEYDPITNKVKNIETGEFEEFDWDLIF